MPEVPDPLAVVAGLARRLDAEVRAEAAEYEALAARDLLRHRSWREVALGHFVRGDRVSVTTTGRTFTGQVTHVGVDVVTVTAAGARMDLWLAAGGALRLVEPAAEPPPERRAEPATFAACLREHEASGACLSIGTRLTCGEIDGRIHAVAPDHLLVAEPGGDLLTVSRSAIEYLVLPLQRPRPSRR